MTENASAKTNGKILSPAEHDACVEIVNMGILPSNKRAEVLLLLNRGVTQKNACEETGLSLGQVRYALSLFRESGLGMFPELSKNKNVDDPEVELEVAAEPEPEVEVESFDEMVAKVEAVTANLEKKAAKKEGKKSKKKKQGKKLAKDEKNKKSKEDKKANKNKIAKKARKSAKKKKKKKKK